MSVLLQSVNSRTGEHTHYLFLWNYPPPPKKHRLGPLISLGSPTLDKRSWGWCLCVLVPDFWLIGQLVRDLSIYK